MLRKTLGRALLSIANTVATIAKFIGDDQDPFAWPEDDDQYPPMGAPHAPVTLSDEARRMVAEGSTAEPVKAKRAPAITEPLRGSYAWRAQNGRG